MTRRKALTIAISVAGLSSLIFVALLMSKPVPAVSHASYAWLPGCHCGKPTATTANAAAPAKATTTTTAKPTTTTAKKVITAATSVAKAVSATTGTTTAAITSTKTSTKNSSTVLAGNSATSTTRRTKRSTTTTGAQNDGAQNGHQNGGLALGAAVASLPGGGDGGSLGGTGDAGNSVAASSVGLPHYYISPVAIGFLLVYGISFILYRTNRLRVATHRKVWNVLLLATFLLCGIMGLVLTVEVTRNPPIELPTWLLVWHVEAGIAMCFISCFHIGWHLRYYLALVTGRRRAPRAEHVPALDRGAPRERARRPRAGRSVLVRTEEDRMLAFKQRQAARAGEARAARPASTPTAADRWVEEVKRGVAPVV